MNDEGFYLKKVKSSKYLTLTVTKHTNFHAIMSTENAFTTKLQISNSLKYQT